MTYVSHLPSGAVAFNSLSDVTSTALLCSGDENRGGDPRAYLLARLVHEKRDWITDTS